MTTYIFYNGVSTGEVINVKEDPDTLCSVCLTECVRISAYTN